MNDHTPVNPPIASYPCGSFQCVLDCVAGTCTDSPADKAHAHLEALDYASQMAAKQSAPPPPCCCTTSHLRMVHAANGAVAADFNWQALIQLLLGLFQQVLPYLTPLLTP